MEGGRLKKLAKVMFRSLYRYKLKILVKQRPCKIVVGAGGILQWGWIFRHGWIPTEIEYLNLLKPDWERYFSSNSIDAILAEHVWEHLTREQGIIAAKNCFQYLKPGGYLRVAVPDGLHPNPRYLKWVKAGGVGLCAKDHKILYTYKTFKEIFELVAFRVNLLEYFDEKGKFHFREWNPNDGMIRRSKRFDRRNREGKLNYTSIILDAWK